MEQIQPDDTAYSGLYSYQSKMDHLFAIAQIYADSVNRVNINSQTTREESDCLFDSYFVPIKIGLYYQTIKSLLELQKP